MPIDNCPHDFATLSATVLPGHMHQLQASIRNPHAMRKFARHGSGPVAIARMLGLASDFSGCYVLLSGQTPIYVGISRKAIARLRQHVTGRSHFDASLAYSIAQRQRPTAGQRSGVMENPQFKTEFDNAQTYLRGLDVAFVEIVNPLELYVFEAFAAMELDTSQWNTFRTH